MTDATIQPPTRERELERYIADLHGRIRHLESHLRTLGQGIGALGKHALTALDEKAADMPEGLHLLSQPERHGAPDHMPTWTIRCSCGWRRRRGPQVRGHRGEGHDARRRSARLD